MKEIIGLVGVIGSGKTYQRDLLVKKGFVAIDFKDELIDMCEDLVGYGIRDNYDKFKESIVGMEPLNAREYTRSYPMAMTGRRLLQRLGTDVMRNRDPEYWIKAWHRKALVALGQGKSVAVADVRFENEVDEILRLGKDLPDQVKTRIVFCNYHSHQYNDKSNHESEKLAQSLIRLGLKDQDEVTPSQILSLKSILQKS
jgi:hypothetical protein